MSQNRWRLGLRSRPPDGAYSAPQTPYLDSGKGPRERGWEEIDRAGKAKRREEKGIKREGKGKGKGIMFGLKPLQTQISGYVTEGPVPHVTALKLAVHCRRVKMMKHQNAAVVGESSTPAAMRSEKW